MSVRVVYPILTKRASTSTCTCTIIHIQVAWLLTNPSPEDMREALRLVEGGAVHDTKMR